MNSPDDDSHINLYQTQEINILGSYHDQPAHYQLMNILLIMLGENTSQSELVELLRLIFKAEISAATKRQQLKTDYNIELIPTDEKELTEMCNLSEGIYERGQLDRAIRLVIDMLKDSEPLEKIIRYSHLPAERIRELAEENGISIA